MGGRSLGAPKQRAVLAMLALQAGRTVSADRLAEGLWGEQPPASAPKMVQLYVSQLRRVLDGERRAIVTRGRGYELRLTDGEVDAIRFERLSSEDAPARGARPVARRGARRSRRRAVRRSRDPAAGGAAPARARARDRRRPRGRPAPRGDRRARGAGRRAPAARAAALAADAGAVSVRAGSPRRSRPTERRARCWSSRSASSRAPSCGSCSTRSSAHDPALDCRAPPRGRRRPGIRPGAASPLLAIAGRSCLAGGARVRHQPREQPESLARIDEDAVGGIDPDSGRITASTRWATARAVPPAGARSGSRTRAMAPSRGSTAGRPSRDDRRRRRADRARLRRRVGVGRRRPGPHGRPDDRAPNKVLQRFDVANAPHAVAVGFGAVWVASAIDATVVLDRPPRTGRCRGRSPSERDRRRLRRGRGRSGSRAPTRRASCAWIRVRGRALARIAVGERTELHRGWSGRRVGGQPPRTATCRASTRRRSR